MLFIWTNDGGPLQYIGLVLFLMQVIVPQIFLWLEDHDMEQMLPPMFTAAPSQQRSQQSAETTTNPSSATYNSNITPDSMSFPWEIAIATMFVVALAFVWYPVMDNNDNTNHAEERGEPQPQHHVPPRADNDDTNQQEPPAAAEQPNRMRHWITRFQRWTAAPEDADGTRRRHRIILSTTIVLTALISFVCVRTGQAWAEHRSTSVSALLVQWIPYVHQFMGLAAVGFELHRRGRRMAGGGNGRTTTSTYTRQQQQVKMNQMVELVKQIPLETFVPQDEQQPGDDGANGGNSTAAEHGYSSRHYSSISIAKLKEMLLLRGVTKAEIDSFVDRQNMVDRLQQCRQYADSCCICFEPYAEGDALRILPRCHHELHVDCLDKWVYTFANHPAKLPHQPSCPLCKESLTCR
jgi:Ring finger domain